MPDTRNNRQTARDILVRHGIDPDERWELLDDISSALTDVEFRTMFGSDNPTLTSAVATDERVKNKAIWDHFNGGGVID